ncbi:MAG: aminotransferase class V-fold PLP-dependent enzyme [Planctomycetota bacterium]
MFRRSFLKAVTAVTTCSKFPDQFQNTNYRNEIPCPNAFAIEEGFDYFNTGGLGPTLKSATAKQLAVLEEIQPRVDRGHKLIVNARPEFAKFLGCSEQEIAYTRNATEGNSTIASGIKLNRGDEIIIDSHAHQGGSVAWMTRQLFDGVILKAFEPDSDSVQGNLDRILQQITPRTKVISVSHVTAPTGIRLPVNEIAKIASDHNLWFHIDGAQSAGMLPLNLKNINCDSFATCGHKWLCGPIGTGLLYVKLNRIDEIKPTEVGDYAAKDWKVPSELAIRKTAGRFESGTRDPASIIGLLEAIRYQKQVGSEKITSHSLSLARYVRDELLSMPKVEVVSPINKELDSAMISFRVEGLKFDRIFSQLWKQKFRCRPVSEQDINAVRISTHYFNTLQQCNRLLDEIRKF